MARHAFLSRSSLRGQWNFHFDSVGLYAAPNPFKVTTTPSKLIGLLKGLPNWKCDGFEEPVSADDLEGLHLLRDHAPAAMEIAAGEYGYTIFYFDRMLRAEAVDVLQVDATRCGGISGIIQVATLCDARCISLSTHTAPALHLHTACALNRICHLEYSCHHLQIEQMLFDGAREPVKGNLAPDLSRPGLGIELKRKVAERFRV